MPILYAGFAALCVLATWLLNLLFRKWFDIVLWPRISDWWASWSQRRLKKKITSLEYKLSKPIRGEEVAIFGVRGVLMFLMFQLVFFVGSLPPGTFPKLPFSMKLTHSLTDAGEDAWARLLLLGITSFIGFWYSQRLSTQYLQWKCSELHRERLEKRIANLKAKLK